MSCGEFTLYGPLFALLGSFHVYHEMYVEAKTLGGGVEK